MLGLRAQNSNDARNVINVGNELRGASNLLNKAR